MLETIVSIPTKKQACPNQQRPARHDGDREGERECGGNDDPEIGDEPQRYCQRASKSGIADADQRQPEPDRHTAAEVDNELGQQYG
jgi:hypothetical protein